VRETYVPGWTAVVDGRPAAVAPSRGPFVEIEVPRGVHNIRLYYDPPEVRLGLRISACALAASILALTGSRRY
jgi:uncharacterized membrane protein YfhO